MIAATYARQALFSLLIASSTAVSAQTAAELVAKGDRDADARRATEAMVSYEAALAIDPKNYDALWRASRTGVDLGEFEPNEAKRTALFKAAEAHGQLAVQVNPGDAEGHFALARALGRTALTLGTRDRIKYATAIREQALMCLKINANHPGCLHVMGVWNAEVMRLNGISRMVAKNFLGGQVFGQASWPEAQRYMLESVKHDPRRIVHRLDLARIYADRGMKPQAKSQFQIAADGELIDYNDPKYKEQAREALKNL
jgi:tetratricopeptide (TPR) repeat protein